MSDFNDIKIGDEVYYQAAVYSDIILGQNVNYFYVVGKVTKTTKTQFTVNNTIRAFKKNGSIIGSYDYIYKKGDTDWKNNPIVDQTKERDIAKLNLKKKERIRILKKEISYTSACPDENLDKVIKMLTKVKELMGVNNVVIHRYSWLSFKK